MIHFFHTFKYSTCDFDITTQKSLLFNAIYGYNVIKNFDYYSIERTCEMYIYNIYLKLESKALSLIMMVIIFMPRLIYDHMT